MDAQQGEVAHRLEEDRNGADVFAEGAVVLEQNGKEDAHHIIDQVADEEQHKQSVFVGFVEMEQQEDEDQRQGKHDVTDKSNLFSWALRLLEGKEVKDHGGPTGIAAPAATEEQWPEDFGDEIMEYACAHHAREQVIPKTLDLHVLPAYQSEEDKHIGSYAKLDEFSGMLPSRLWQSESNTDDSADITEVNQIE